MAALSRLEIERIARMYFGDLGEEAVAIATAIAFAESGGDPAAVGDNYPRWQTADSPYRWDRGLMQINSIHGYSPLALMDPAFNMSVARRIYNMQGWNAWTTYRWGLHTQHLQPTTPPEAPAPDPDVLDVNQFPVEDFTQDTEARARFLEKVYQRAYGYGSSGAQIYRVPAPEGVIRYLVEMPASS